MPKMMVIPLHCSTDNFWHINNNNNNNNNNNVMVPALEYEQRQVFVRCQQAHTERVTTVEYKWHTGHTDLQRTRTESHINRQLCINITVLMQRMCDEFRMHQKWSDATDGEADDETLETSLPAQCWSIWNLNKQNTPLFWSFTTLNINIALVYQS